MMAAAVAGLPLVAHGVGFPSATYFAINFTEQKTMGIHYLILEEHIFLKLDITSEM